MTVALHHVSREMKSANVRGRFISLLSTLPSQLLQSSNASSQQREGQRGSLKKLLENTEQTYLVSSV